MRPRPANLRVGQTGATIRKEGAMATNAPSYEEEEFSTEFRAVQWLLDGIGGFPRWLDKVRYRR